VVRPEKIERVRLVAERLRASQSVVLTDFRGLTVAEITDLRGRLRGRGVEYKVLKNRLGRRALAEAGCDALDDWLVGNTAWAFGLRDAIEPAKVLSAYAQENEKLKIKGGLLERRRIDAGMVAELAALPSRPELLSRMAGGLKQPAARLASAMSQAVARMARAFAVLAEKREKAGVQIT